MASVLETEPQLDPFTGLPVVETEDPPQFEPNRHIGFGIFIHTDMYGVPYRIDADKGTWEELRRGDH